jgi:zinc carboxypeptidase
MRQSTTRLLFGGACLALATSAFTIMSAQSASPTAALPALGAPFVRDPSIPIDEDYTHKITEYTTAPYFSSPLVDYLPASKTVPTPKAVLGDIAGAPSVLPYSADVHRYMRMLQDAAPERVKVLSIGTTEEGREMIAVAISSEANMARLARVARRNGRQLFARVQCDLEL